MFILPKFNESFKNKDDGGRKSRRTSYVAPKKPIYKKWWFIVGVVLFVLIIILPTKEESKDSTSGHSAKVEKTAVSKKKTDTKKDDASKKEDETMASKKEVNTKKEDVAEDDVTEKDDDSGKKMGSVEQPLRVGDVEYTVHSYKTADSVGGEYLNQKANGVYLIVNVTVKNLGKKPLSVDSDYFELRKGDSEYESDSTAGLYANEDGKFFHDKINPDGELTGNVVFDVTKETADASDLMLQVQTGAWGTQKGLITLTK